MKKDNANKLKYYQENDSTRTIKNTKKKLVTKAKRTRRESSYDKENSVLDALHYFTTKLKISNW